jgi:ribosome-binding factor A
MQGQVSFRIERINELVRRELALLLKNETRDPRLAEVSITDVLVSRDLSTAKVFFTAPEHKRTLVAPLLKKAAGFYRARLSKLIELRHTPELRFIFDEAPNTGARIEDLLSKL